MKILLVVTRKSDELKKLGMPDSLKIHDDIKDGTKLIIMIKGGTGDAIQERYRVDVIPVLSKLSGNIIILHHNSDHTLLTEAIRKNEQLVLLKEVNCASIENNAEVNALDRQCYDEFIVSKWDIFDAVWKRFSQIDPHEAALRQLHNILNGTQKFIIASEKEPVLYDNEKQTHRIALSKMRDELLTF